MYEIKVINNQSIDGETAVTEETAECAFNLRNGRTYIIYKASYEGDEVSTMIVVSERETVIKRSGYINSRMVYRAGNETSFPYKTPYGTISMRLFTDEINCNFTDSGGELRLLYTLDIQGEKYYNDMIITVREIL